MLSKRYLFADMTPSKAATEPGSQTNLHEIRKEKASNKLAWVSQ